MNGLTVKTLRQMIAFSLVALWVLCLFYRPVHELHYTYGQAFLDALFNWSVSFAWYVRIILIAPIALLAGVTALYIAYCQKSISVKSCMVTFVMAAAFSLHSAYGGFIMWGQDLVSVFLTYHLELQHDTFLRVAQWILYEDFWVTHWHNVVVSFGFQLCLSSYRQMLRLEEAQRPPQYVLNAMPLIPLDEHPLTMPVVPN